MKMEMKAQKGFSLIGILFSIAIISLIIGKIVSTYQATEDSSKSHILINEIRTILNGALSLKGSRDVASLAADMRQRDMMPTSWIPSDYYANSSAYETNWGLASISGIGNWFGENPDGFTADDGIHVFVSRVPLDICYDVINTLQAEVDYISYGASNAPTADPSPIGVIKSPYLEYSSAAASEACDDRSLQGQRSMSIRLAVFR